MSRDEYPLLKCLDPDKWEYLAEGFDSIIFEFIGSDECYKGKVLRLFKNQNDGYRRGNSEPLVDFKDKLRILLQFQKNYVDPYLDNLDMGEPVKVTHEFVSALADVTEPKRPETKIRQSYVCRTSTVGLIHKNHIIPGLLVVELKPKWGFCPCCPLLPEDCVLRKVCMFQILQRLKLAKGDIKEISNYDPRDMFSGDAARVRKALDAIIKNPQGNLKVFRNGKSELTEEEKEVVIRLLAKSETLKKILALQRLDVWDVQCLEGILAKAENPRWETLADDEVVIQGVRDRMVNGYKLPEKVSEVNQIVNEMDRDSARINIAAFLIAQSAKDCSIMMTFKDGIKSDPEVFVIDFDLKMPELLVSQYLKSERQAIAKYMEMEQNCDSYTTKI